MRKQTKIAAVASAAALLAIGASMTAFAAEWIKYDDGTWSYVDSDGEYIEGWHPYNNDGNRYYISPEDGLMVTSDIIEVDGDYYYVNSSGARVSDKWVEVSSDKGFGLDEYEGDIEDSYYYYVQKNGKILVGDGATHSVRLTNSTSDKGLFYFDEYGRMMTGWIKTEDGHYIYCDPEGTDGRVLGQAVKEDWLDLNTVTLTDELQDIADEEDMRDDSSGKVWFYFGKDGKNYISKNDEKINGKRYCFDANGVMAWNEWVKVNSTTKYYALSDGRLAEKVWRKIGDYYYYFEGRKAFGVNEETKKDGDKTVYTYADVYTPKYLNGEYYFFDCEGKLVADKVVDTSKGGNLGKLTPADSSLSQKVADHLYYFDGKGNMVVGAQFTDADGNTGFVNNQGAVVTAKVAIIGGYVYAYDEELGFSVLVTPAYEDYAYVVVEKKDDIVCYTRAGKADASKQSTYDKYFGEGVQDILVVVKDNGALATSKSDVVAESNVSASTTKFELKTDSYGVVVEKAAASTGA